MENPKVLVAAPIFDGMKYCLKEFLDGVKNLSYEDKEILLVDNSKEDAFYEELKKETGIIVLRDETEELKSINKIINGRNKIIEFALKNNYDFILMFDSDVVPPRDIIEELLSCKEEIASGVYYAYFMSSGKMKYLPVVWMGITESEFDEIKKKIKLPAHFTKEDLQRHMTDKEVESGKVFEVFYPSAGCMLLSRKVFETVRYPRVPDEESKAYSDDILFIKKAKEKGFKPYVNTRVRCEHLVSGKYKKDEKGNLVHPLNPEYWK